MLKDIGNYVQLVHSLPVSLLCSTPPSLPSHIQIKSESTMHSVNLHQTSKHAVLIVHLRSIDPTSVTSQISLSRHFAEISFNHTDSNSTILATTVQVRPVLTQQEQQLPSQTDLIQECSYSVSSENIVIRFKKTSALCEWQALRIDFKTHSATSNGELSLALSSTTEMEGVVVEQTRGGESSVVAKFVTVANTTSFQEAIQGQPLWDQAGSHVVGNVQAKRVPGMNAIQMTAQLVSPSS